MLAKKGSKNLSNSSSKVSVHTAIRETYGSFKVIEKGMVHYLQWSWHGAAVL